MTEETKTKLKKMLKVAGKVGEIFIVGLAAAGTIFLPMILTGCGQSNQKNNGTTITNPTSSTNPVNPGQVNPSDPGNTGKPIINPPTTDPGKDTPPGEEIVEKTEEELVAEYWQEIEDKFQDSLGYAYFPDDEEFYYYEKQDGVVSLNCFGTLGEDLQTSAGLKKLLDTWGNRNVLELFNFEATNDEIQIGDTVYGEPIKGKTDFTDQMGIETAQVVSKFGGYTKDGNKYSMTCCAVTAEKTYMGHFSAEIDKENPTEEEIYEAVMANCEDVDILEFGMDVNEIEGAKTPQTIETPEVTTLDYSALEQKLEEVIEDSGFLINITEILSYSVIDDVLLTVVKMPNSVRTYEFALDENVSLETQQGIDQFVDSLSKDALVQGEGAKPISRVSITCASSDITVDGTTYSKEGIDGDNIFAAQCGVTNGAVKTYVSDMKSRTYGDYPSGYCRGFDVLVVGDDRIGMYHGTVDYDCATDNHWDNIIIDDKHSISLTGAIDIGKNLKVEKEVQPSAVAMEK